MTRSAMTKVKFYTLSGKSTKKYRNAAKAHNVGDATVFWNSLSTTY